jgi:hypothetical protein
MLKKRLFTLICLAIFACLSAVESRAQITMKGTGAWNGCVVEAYQQAFGRSASPQELSVWKKIGADNSDCGPEVNSRVLEALKSKLRAPEGAKELADTISRAYQHSFGRAPNAGDLNYWTAEIFARQQNLGYAEIMNSHRLWLKNDKNQGDRTYAVYQAYLNGIGRAPNPGDLEYWRNRMKEDGSNYTDCLKANVLYITGNSPAQVQERLETIKRAFAVAKLGSPNGPMQSQMSALVVQKKPHFKRLTELVIATFPNAPKQYDFPDPK